MNQSEVPKTVDDFEDLSSDIKLPLNQNGFSKDGTDKKQCQSKPHQRISTETKSILFLSFAFLLCFTSYMSVEILQTSLNQKDNLGLFSLCGIYGSYFFVGIMTPSIIRVVGIKRTIILGFVSHVIYLGGNFYPHFYTLIPASIIVGLMSPLIWVSLSVFLSTTALSYAENFNQKPLVALSKFNGLFYIIFNCQHLPGNILSSSVFSDGVVHHNVTNQTSCGPNGCPMVKNATETDSVDQNTVYIFLSVLVAAEVTALLMIIFLVPSMEKSTWSTEVKLFRSFVGCCETFIDYRLLFLAPMLIYTTLVKAVRVTDFTKSYISCPFGIQMVGFVMATYGGSGAVFAFIFGRVAKYTKRYALFAVAMLTDMTMYFLLYHWTPQEQDIHYVFIIAAIWGAGEGIWQTQTNALVGLLFSEKKEPAFACYHTLKATGYTTYFIMSYFLCVKTKLFVVMVWLGMAAVMYTIIEIILKYKRIQNRISDKHHETGEQMELKNG